MKITVTLSPEQEKYFHNVKYGLMDIDANNSDVINHILMEALLFEEFRDDQITNFLHTNHNAQYAHAITDKKRDFGSKLKPKPEIL